MVAPTACRERQLVLVMADLARFTQAVAGLELSELAALVDAFYRAAGEEVAAHGGRVVKFVGDGCFAVFEPTDALAALDAVDQLRERVRDLARREGLALDLGANLHLSTVAEAELGLDALYDVIGMGVVHVFRMGSGAGTRISEPVYRKLPSDRRSPWHRRQPPATYTWEEP
jgi:class 3 adenylate cyclase